MNHDRQEQSGASQLAEPEQGRFDCPLCGSEQARRGGTRFCIHCGVPVVQPCPKCRREIDTERTRASTCAHCREPLWKCQKCYRYYRLDQLSCANHYCESAGVPWTSLEGKEVWSHPAGDLARTNWGSADTPESLVPWWQWIAPGDPDMHAPVNALGMVVCASRARELWCLAEAGTEAAATPGEYECSPIVLYDTSLASNISAGPVILEESAWLGLSQGEVVQLDLLSGRVHYHATSLGGRVEELLPCPRGLLVAGPNAVAILDDDGAERHLFQLPAGVDLLPPVAVGPAGTASLVVGWNREGRFQSVALKHGKDDWEPIQALNHPVEHLLGGERLYMVSRDSVRVLSREGPGGFPLAEHPLVAPPAFDPESDRLVLCLGDQSVRTFRHDGTRVSFRSALTGTPTGPPLLLGRSVLYGTQERFLCLSERTASPRLAGRVHPYLSIANGRVFCTTERGGVYAFTLAR
ncbi:MAG: hypothetical protein HY319_21675 [Armatimonadetes bacterium]|nr:hypothetical protein [Armatimonadota bacterium]